jgi:exodeoxyribonuclease VII large subunit
LVILLIIRNTGKEEKMFAISDKGPDHQAHIYTLSELNSLIKVTIEDTFPDTLWVIAEISDARCDQKGHCYLELVEREDDRKTAQVRATIWSYNYRTLSHKFKKTTGETLRQGMKVLLLITVTFHEVFGLSLNIKDIDPTYSLGEMARKKREVIERLKKEGIVDLNRKLPLPRVPQRIAVISSPTAAGYGDFVNHLKHNPYGYRIHCMLYSALMQGEGAEPSIVVALRKMLKRINLFDLAVIIRGGGSQTDLSCFDRYGIASEVARFPIPVITGIGHERDDTVTDMVAHTKCKTPTDVAQFIISGLRGFEERITELQRKLVRHTERLMKDNLQTLSTFMHELRYKVMQTLSDSRRGIDRERQKLISSLKICSDKRATQLISYEKDLKLHIKQVLTKEITRLDGIEQAIKHLDPENIMKRGYSITYLNGKAIRDVHTTEKGSIIETKLYNGLIISKVEVIKDEG